MVDLWDCNRKNKRNQKNKNIIYRGNQIRVIRIIKKIEPKWKNNYMGE